MFHIHIMYVYVFCNPWAWSINAYPSAWWKSRSSKNYVKLCKTDHLLCNKSSVCSINPSCAVTMITEFARFYNCTLVFHLTEGCCHRRYRTINPGSLWLSIPHMQDFLNVQTVIFQFHFLTAKVWELSWLSLNCINRYFYLVYDCISAL